ncbi:hypothetical protein MRB53_039398 [Persea americana]|nr:hypothetical protein MRB53_039398 [Persea americana]
MTILSSVRQSAASSQPKSQSASNPLSFGILSHAASRLPSLTSFCTPCQHTTLIREARTRLRAGCRVPMPSSSRAAHSSESAPCLQCRRGCDLSCWELRVPTRSCAPSCSGCAGTSSWILRRAISLSRIYRFSDALTGHCDRCVEVCLVFASRSTFANSWCGYRKSTRAERFRRLSTTLREMRALA